MTPTVAWPAPRLNDTVLAGLARRRQPANATREQAIRHAEIRRLALALREAARALKANRTELTAIVNDLVPGLTNRPGIGPISAAQAIVSFSHPGRCRNDAAFAKFAGTSPIEASSGQTTRHRLNQNGDRALNRAIHTIANTRDTQRSPHPGLPAPPPHRRQIRPRNPTLPQAIHHPPALPHPHHRHEPQHRSQHINHPTAHTTAGSIANDLDTNRSVENGPRRLQR